MLKSLALAVLLPSVTATLSHAQTDLSHLPTICEQKALDIHALPPASSSPVPNNHLFVLEVQNIGTTPCTLQAANVMLMPQFCNSDSGAYLL